MKFRRILAFFVDWNLCGIPALVYAMILRRSVAGGQVSPLEALLFFLFVLSYPVLFVLRDVIFGGRSPAKRMLRLFVIDNATQRKPANSKLIVRNLLFMLCFVDFIVLLASNRTLGDAVTNTAVI